MLSAENSLYGLDCPPNGKPFLRSLNLTAERLRSETKMVMSVATLRAVLSLGVSTLPFDDEFYLSTYPDIADAYRSGKIADLHLHFITDGYIEGRLGARPNFDEEFYQDMYPDIATAVVNGELTSALDHYINAGAAEGRFCNVRDMLVWEQWLPIIGPDQSTATD